MTERLLDPCGEADASRLAASMQEFWHKKGHTNVKFWVEHQTARLSVKSRDGAEKFRYEPIFGVRSNLVGGMPPKQQGEN